MAKKAFSAETRAKIAAKARERERKKRESRGKLPGGSSTALAVMPKSIAVSGDVVDPDERAAEGNFPPAEEGDDDISKQAKKKIGELRDRRETLAKKVEELTTRARSLKEAADLAVVERDKIFDKHRSNGSIAPTGKDARLILSISEGRKKALEQLLDVRGKRKAAKAGIADALAETDRILAGEDPKGTIFEETAKKKKRKK